MFIPKKTYDALISAYTQTIASKDAIIEQYKKEVENLEARIEYHRRKKEKQDLAKPKKNYYTKPTTTIVDEDRHDPYPEE